MLRKTIEGSGGFLVDHPRLAAVVTCYAKGTNNALAITWHSPLSEAPPLFGVAIRSSWLSHELIIEAREFAVNFLPFEKAELVAALGGSTGRKADKFEAFGLAREKALKISAPILHEAYAAYECVLQEHHVYGDHEWFVGRVVASHFAEEALKDGAVDVTMVKPVLYLAADKYVTTHSATVCDLPRGETARRLQK